MTADTASPSHTPSAPRSTPRKNLRSPSSDINAGKQVTHKSSRGSLHGDISAARHGFALKAREADLEAREAKLRNEQAENDRRMQAALQTSKAEVTHLRQRTQRADELEHLLSNMHERP